MTRIANSTEAVRHAKLLDRIQSEDFARAWRDGRREEVLARHHDRLSANYWDTGLLARPRPAFGHIPYPHRTCADWLNPSVAPRGGPVDDVTPFSSSTGIRPEAR